jgi:hypothetical protein
MNTKIYWKCRDDHGDDDGEQQDQTIQDSHRLLSVSSTGKFILK